MKCQSTSENEFTQWTQRIILERSQEQMPVGFIDLSAFLEEETMCDVVGKT